ncbi:SDR family NAD(P)-dependent oxidoreductase [Chloroflexota bacterium]
MYDLSGKVALVTGASNRKGIGCGIALGLAREGADVIVTDRSRAPENFAPWDRAEGWKGLESLVGEIEAMGRRGLAINADLTKRQDITNLVDKALKGFGKIDILVNNAAIISGDTGLPDVIDFPEEIWNRSLTVNLTAPFLLCKAIAPQMIKRGEGGRIINILSQAAKRGNRGRADYASTKFGFNGLTQVLTNELGKYKITVNGICPGLIASFGSMGKPIWIAMSQGGLSEDDAIDAAYGIRFGVESRPKLPKEVEDAIWEALPSKKQVGRPMNPLERVGRVSEIASLALFLASSESAFITGQAINIGGGAVMH